MPTPGFVSTTTPAAASGPPQQPAGDGRSARWWLVAAFLVATLFGASSYIWEDWGGPDERTLYSTVSFGVAAVLLGMLAAAFSNLNGKETAVVVVVLAVVCTTTALTIAYCKIHQPIDVTDKVTLAKGEKAVMAADGEGFDLSVPLPEDRDTLNLTFNGTDPDRVSGTNCLPRSSLRLTGAALPHGKDIPFDGKAVTVPISDRHNAIQLHIELRTDHACRIRVAVSRAVLES
ncbi:hypothetical protein [Streptomyces sp. NPDC050263]|uniref:hypothetical protein n=1 Tax=Streptomyces sp. NPDC050263 TaxID=3155037 RepID=UPI00342ABC77